MRTELKEGLLRGAATVLLLSAVFWSAGQTAILVNEDQAETEDRFCVVIDAGHGGVDPGKVGRNGELEKELNLQIAEKLKLFLEASDVEVVMTRTTDTGLYDENASNKKVQDMKQRIQIIEEAQPDIAVSIHQNSYDEEYVKGAQVFYYGGGGVCRGTDSGPSCEGAGSGKPQDIPGERQLLSSEKDREAAGDCRVRLSVQSGGGGKAFR